MDERVDDMVVGEHDPGRDQEAGGGDVVDLDLADAPPHLLELLEKFHGLPHELRDAEEHIAEFSE